MTTRLICPRLFRLSEPSPRHGTEPTNELWIADITYIRLETEFVYLAVVLDAYSRWVIRWALGRTRWDDMPIEFEQPLPASSAAETQRVCA